MRFIIPSIVFVLFESPVLAKLGKVKKHQKDAPPVKVQTFSFTGGMDGGKKLPQAKGFDSHIASNRNYDTSIVGGDDAKEGDYPWFGE